MDGYHTHRIAVAGSCTVLAQHSYSAFVYRPCVCSNPRPVSTRARFLMSGHWFCRRPCGVQNYTQVADLNGAYCRMFREFASRDWTLESLKVRPSIKNQK
jgi:hypothetical protein